MKKTFTKIIATVLVLTMLLSCVMILTAGAAETKTGTISVSYYKSGETAVAYVDLMKNPGINTLMFRLGYNKDAIELVTAENGDVFSESNNGSMFELNTAKNPLVCYFEENGVANITSNGTVMKLTFKILDSSADLGLTLVVDNDNTFGCAVDKIEPVDIDFGTVTVSGYIRGDVSGDGKVNAVDAVTMGQFLVASLAFNGAQMAVGDLNGDGKVNAVDANLEALIIVGKYN